MAVWTRSVAFLVQNVEEPEERHDADHFKNRALYSSEEEALDYAHRIHTAQVLQRDEADEIVAVELPGPRKA
jgi:hypothetical protein